MFFRLLPDHPSAPLKEIFLPPMPMTPTKPTKAPEELNCQKKNVVPCKPLPPPPFRLMNQKKPIPAPVSSDDDSENDNCAYYVDSVRGMNLVKLLRAKDIVDKPKEKPTITSTTDVSRSSKIRKICKEAKPQPKRKANNGPKRVKKPRKKWLPSLGPPESEALRILAKAASKDAWYCDNAELFSTMSTLQS